MGTCGVAQDRVDDGTGAMVSGVPADDHEVGARGQAGQRPARVTEQDVLADLDIGVPGAPVIDQCRQPLGDFGSVAWALGSLSAQ